MGTFTQKLKIFQAGDPAEFTEIEALVDTGAFYTWGPRQTLEALGYRPDGRRPFVIAMGQIVERDVCEIRVALNGDSCTTKCVFGDAGGTSLLGAYTLEGLALGVDPVGKKLIPLPALPAM